MPELDPRRWQALAIVCVAFFMTILDVSIVNVALPSIQNVAARQESTLQWVISRTRSRSAASCSSAAAPPTCSDAAGSSCSGWPLRAASLVCGLAGSIAVLIVARTVQGVGAAIVSPADALDHHDDLRRGLGAQQGARHLGRDGRQRRRGRRALRRHPHEVRSAGNGSSSSTCRSGVVLAPDAPDRAREPHRPGLRGFDAGGAVTITAGLALLVYAISKAPDVGWGTGRTIGLLIGAAVLFAAFVVVERRTRRRWSRSASSASRPSPGRTSPGSCSAPSSSRTSSC